MGVVHYDAPLQAGRMNLGAEVTVPFLFILLLMAIGVIGGIILQQKVSKGK